MLIGRGREFILDLRSTIDNQQSAISNQQSAISNQQSAISNQQSAISNSYGGVASSADVIGNYEQHRQSALYREALEPG
jgi:hypothetical protein